MNNKTYTCIICPNGCEITVEYDENGYFNCEGNLCSRGEEYVHREITAPQRTISSSVLVTGGDMPLVSVRLTKPVPKEKIFDIMREIKSISLNAPVEAGTVIVENILGLGSNLIATRSVKEEKA